MTTTVQETFEGTNPLDNFDAKSAGRLTVQAASALGGLMGLQFTPAASTSFVKWRERLWQGGVQFFPYWSARFYVRFPSLPGGNPPSIFTARTVGAVDDFTFFYNVGTGTWKWDLDINDSAQGPVVAVNRWYLVEAKGSYAASPWTADVRIDGVNQGSVATVGNPAELVHELSWGPQVSTQTWTADMDAFEARVSSSPLGFLGPGSALPSTSVRPTTGATTVGAAAGHPSTLVGAIV